MKKVKAYHELKGDVYFIFKHSNICPISAHANEVMEEMEPKVKVPIYMVVVQTDREVSDEVEIQTKIKHESPQLILIKNGQPVWNISHYRISKEEIEKALEKYL